MCFSAPVSFGASAILGATGVYLLAKTGSTKYWVLAVIPFLFAIQQLIEGLVWLQLYLPFSKDIYLFFALAFWPFWINFALWYLEIFPKRKQALSFLWGMATVMAIVFVLTIQTYEVHFYKLSIDYQSPFYSRFGILTNISYTLIALSPFFISSVRKMWIVGLVVFLTGTTIYIIDQKLLISIWCFFAAVMSVSFIWLIKQNQIKNSP